VSGFDLNYCESKLLPRITPELKTKSQNKLVAELLEYIPSQERSERKETENRQLTSVSTCSIKC